MNIDADEIATTYMATAKNRLYQTGHISPQAFIFSHAGVIAVPYMVGSFADYKLIITAVANMAQANYIILIAQANRANFATPQQAQHYEGLLDPQQVPGAEPCILVQVSTPQLSILKFAPYVRIVDAYIFGDIETHSFQGGAL